MHLDPLARWRFRILHDPITFEQERAGTHSSRCLELGKILDAGHVILLAAMVVKYGSSAGLCPPGRGGSYERMPVSCSSQCKLDGSGRM